MLHKSKSNKINQLKFGIVLPLLALFMMSFNTKDIYVEIPSETTPTTTVSVKQNDNVEVVISKDTTDEELKALQDKLKSKGITFNYSNVKRNSNGEITSIKTDFKNAKNSSNYSISGDDGIKAFRFKSSKDSFNIGSIDSQNTFVYESKDGKTISTSSGSNVFVLESDDSKDKVKAKKIKIKSSSTIDTVYFKTQGQQAAWVSEDGTKTKIVASENGNHNVYVTRDSDEPIYIVDGKVVSKATIEDVDSEDIQSINVIKGKAALQTYGDKGKNGVIVLTKKGSPVTVSGSNSFTYELIDTDGEQPLYIIDGKVSGKGKTISNLDPNSIVSVDVIKGEKAVTIYGKKAKNGAVLVKTKNSKDGKIIVTESQSQPIVVKGTYAYVVSDSTTEFVISKNSSDAFLKQKKNDLKKQGIDAKFSKVRRNKAGEITSIKISLSDDNGRKSSSSWREKDQAIPDIVLGKHGDRLFIRAIND